MASEASHITHEVFGGIRAGGSSLARPRADLLVHFALPILISFGPNFIFFWFKVHKDEPFIAIAFVFDIPMFFGRGMNDLDG